MTIITAQTPITGTVGAATFVSGVGYTQRVSFPFPSSYHVGDVFVGYVYAGGLGSPGGDFADYDFTWTLTPGWAEVVEQAPHWTQTGGGIHSVLGLAMVTHVVAAGEPGTTVNLDIQGATVTTPASANVTGVFGRAYRNVRTDIPVEAHTGAEINGNNSGVPSTSAMTVSALSSAVSGTYVTEAWLWRSPNTPTFPSGLALQVNSGLALTDFVQAAPGVLPSRTSNNNATSSFAAALQAILDQALPPLAPSDTAPANGQYLDATQPIQVAWTYNPSPGDPSVVQAAYALRQKPAGGSYVYWNNGTQAWQAGIIWNVAASTSVTLPVGALTNGNVYNWAVATQSSTDASLQGPFAADQTLVTQAIPTISGISPSGTIANAQPLVQWTDGLASGAVQTFWRVKIFSAAQYSVTGFNPATAAATVDSSLQSGTATSYAVPTSLDNNVSYRTYVQITQSGSQTSAWTYNTFALSYDTPATPAVTAIPYTDPLTGAPCVQLIVDGFDNLLTANQASMTTDATGWAAGSNTTLAVQSSHVEDGTQALRMTATASGSVTATQAGGSIPVNVGSTYTARADFYPEGTTRTATVKITWKTAGGATISSNSGNATEVGSTFTTASVTAVAPAGATQVDITISLAGCAASEKHDVDNIGLFPGTSTAWWRGGLNGLTNLELQFSDDGGVTWEDVRNASAIQLTFPDQTSTLLDYESPSGQSRQYRAQVTALVSGLLLSSDWSTIVLGMSPATSLWWIKNPLDSTAALSFNNRASLQLQQPEKAVAHALIGRNRAVVVTDGLLGMEGALQIGVLGEEAYSTLRTLLQSVSTLLIQSPFGEQWYAHFGATTTGSAYRQWQTQQDTLNNPYSVLAVPFVEVDRP